METTQRAAKVVADAESMLKLLIAEAAQNGDYASVELLVHWASMLRDIVGEARHDAKLAIQAPANPIDANKASASAPPTPKTSKATSKRRSYPFFAKSGDSLVKVAWSKSSKSEYQHKSTRIVTLKLASVLAKQGRSGSVVTMEKVLPLVLDDGVTVPDYQAYVSLAWFKQIGIVKQLGRQGYSINRPAELETRVDAAWAELAEARPA